MNERNRKGKMTGIGASKHGLPSIANEDTRIFILGSLPGDRSLKAGRYYAHPTNQFWKLVGVALKADFSVLTYSERLERLAQNGIGLWDVVSAAEREGSADIAIRNATHNDLGGLKRKYPKLRAVAFNGGRAAKDGFRLLSHATDLDLIALPSSSGLARMSFDEKLEAWSQLAKYAGPEALPRA